MSPEQPQNQYVEKAQLADLSEEMKKLQSDPTYFDEDALREEFRARLDKAIGKVQLNDRQFRQYQEAIRKIDDNISRLREMRDYLVMKVRMVEIEKYVKPDGSQIRPKEDGVAYVLYVADYESLINFISARPPLIIKSNEYSADIARAREALKGVGGLMAEHYSEKFQSLGIVEEQNVKQAVQDKRMTLVDYLDLEDAIDTLTELLRDKGQLLDKWAEKDEALDKSAREAEDRLMKMSEILIASRKNLSQQDLFAVENFDRAFMKTGPAAMVAQSEAINYRAMIYNKQRAEKTRLQALAHNPDPQVYQNALGILAEAERAAAINHGAADRLYMDAHEMFNTSQQAYLAQVAEREVQRRVAARSKKKKTS